MGTNDFTIMRIRCGIVQSSGGSAYLVVLARLILGIAIVSIVVGSVLLSDYLKGLAFLKF